MKAIWKITVLFFLCFFCISCNNSSEQENGNRTSLEKDTSVEAETSGKTEKHSENVLADSSRETQGIEGEKEEITKTIEAFYSAFYSAWCELGYPDFDTIMDPDSVAAHNIAESYKMRRDEMVFCLKYLSPFQFYLRWGFNLKQFSLKDKYEIVLGNVTEEGDHVIAEVKLKLQSQETDYPFFIAEENVFHLRKADGHWYVAGRSSDSMNHPACDITDISPVRYDYEDPDSVARSWIRSCSLDLPSWDFDAEEALKVIEKGEPDLDSIEAESSKVLPGYPEEMAAPVADGIREIIEQYYERQYSSWCEGVVPEYSDFLDTASLFGNNVAETYRMQLDSKKIYAEYVPEHYTEEDRKKRDYRIQICDVIVSDKEEKGDTAEAVVIVTLADGIYPFFFSAGECTFCLSNDTGRWKISGARMQDDMGLGDGAFRIHYVNPEALKNKILLEWGGVTK